MDASCIWRWVQAYAADSPGNQTGLLLFTLATAKQTIILKQRPKYFLSIARRNVEYESACGGTSLEWQDITRVRCVQKLTTCS